MSLPSTNLALDLKTQTLASARRLAGDGANLAALEAISFPERKTERWKYTSLQALADGHMNAVASGELSQPLPA
ncbi:MAG: Fe-S cluster assembly protein SufD, partial [Alcanivorax sediminis]